MIYDAINIKSVLSKAIAMLKSAFFSLIKIFLVCLVVVWLVFSRCTEGFRVENGKPALVKLGVNGREINYIQGADPETFKSLDNAEDSRIIYAADAHRVYMGSSSFFYMLIDSADPGTFKILTSDGIYTADKDHVYWFGVELEEADPATFRVIENPYAVDVNRAYAGIVPFKVHSTQNFEVYEVGGYNRPTIKRNKVLIIEDRSKAYVSGWSRDGTAYYWGGNELKGADYDSLEILNGLHAKDFKTVYFKDEPISGADAESFNIVGTGSIRGQDNNFEYKEGQRVGRRKQ